MSLQIYNTLTQRKEPFVPVQPGKVAMYVCGPTVYKPSHIGHAVGPIIFDMVKRYLTFKGYKVTWVVNITDVDDKLIEEARIQHCSVKELAERVTASYLEAMEQLGVHGIDHMPRASEYIPGIIDMCRRLIDKSAAYVSGGDVYFDITSARDYGKLSHRNPEEQEAGKRDLVGAEKRHEADFALWKAAKPDEPAEVQFDSPWGKGRPGWHIECSAMSGKLLGMTFDIHGGGDDLKFPHHENEIAQSETCWDAPFVRYWMHHNLTRFQTKKISKSDPEMRKKMAELTLSHLLSKYPAELLRFVVLSSHYRSPIEFGDEELAARQKGLSAFYRLFDRVHRLTGRSPYEDGPDLDQIQVSVENDGEKSFVAAIHDAHRQFLMAMDDDFNTGKAIGVLFGVVNAINRFLDDGGAEAGTDSHVVDVAAASVQTMRRMAGLLGLFERPATRPGGGDGDKVVDDLMGLLLAVRAQAKKDKQYAIADMIRDQLARLGIKLEDRRDGMTEWRR